DKPTLFDSIVAHKWKNIEFASYSNATQSDAAPYQYNMIRGIDFYHFASTELSKFPNVTRHIATVESLQDIPGGAVAKTDRGNFSGRWIFNSCYLPEQFPHSTSSSFYLLQHFKGWEIETSQAVFTPDKMMLMDFRTPQNNNARFFYVLPFAENRALVEYTVFSKSLLDDREYDTALRSYIALRLGIQEFRILHEEQNAIPMTDRTFPKALGDNIMNIGIAGGSAKPTTGYTFMRIQRDCEEIVNQLQRTDQPFYKPSIGKRFALYDSLLLDILNSEKYPADHIFSELFKHNSISRILRFLDEKSSNRDEVNIFYNLPWSPFLKALANYILRLLKSRSLDNSWESLNQYFSKSTFRKVVSNSITQQMKDAV
ncbi:MAG: lycopene cyclase family protein, partial [Calditrichota bacterium]